VNYAQKHLEEAIAILRAVEVDAIEHIAQCLAEVKR
jgi:hypothetical protein